jgi:amino acid transporter
VGLVRALGPVALAASIFNVTVGGGIFRLPAAAAAMIGPAAPLVYLVCAAVMALIVLCFAEAGSRVALTGGPYAYVEVVFGPYAGFLAGVLVWMLGTLAMASVATAFAGSVAALVPALAAPGGRAGVLVATFALLAWINARGVRQGARLIEVVSVAKLLPLLVLVGRRRLLRAPGQPRHLRASPTAARWPAPPWCSSSPSPASRARSCRAARCATRRARCRARSRRP